MRKVSGTETVATPDPRSVEGFQRDYEEDRRRGSDAEAEETESDLSDAESQWNRDSGEPRRDDDRRDDEAEDDASDGREDARDAQDARDAEDDRREIPEDARREADASFEDERS